jgi:ribonucleoside-diphosphate reductase alpha chain
LYELEATNPCGEQFLGPYENCCLGSINLAQHIQFVNDLAAVDWHKLEETVVLATRFLDNVVTVNKYVPPVPALKEAALRARRIGLGIMGLADLMYHLNIRYGSVEAQEFAGQVMEFIRYHVMFASIELAKQRGPFPAIADSLYDPANLNWQPPMPLVPHTHNWARPAIDWQVIVEGIRQYGIRNAAQATIAPTGTIGTVAGCEGYGCEPVFALAYVRHVNDNGQDLQLTYASPLFEQALIKAGIAEPTRRKIYDQVMLYGSCQNVADVPPSIRHVFVVSQDITPQEHVRMQAALQRFVDNSISKTTNLPPTATEEDVAQAYFLAWELGCKGLTVYVTGSRESVVLETQATRQAKEQRQAPLPIQEAKKPRPKVLPGQTFRMGTPLGTTFVTINENGGSEPFEIFMHTSKAGSETYAVSEAMGRLISYILRLSSPITPTDRLKEVVKQLNGIGGGRPMGFGPNRILSLPDGLARVLGEYLEMRNGNEAKAKSEPQPKPQAQPKEVLKGDLCPECGQAAVVQEEGCRKCYACGYSEC